MPRIALKDTRQEVNLFNRRALILALGMALLFGALVWRLVYLQVIQQSLYTTLSTQNQVSLIPIEPNRGLIYDRNGILLAENLPYYSLDYILDKARYAKETLQKLKQIIPISREEQNEFFKQLQQRRRFEPVPIKTRLTEAQIARFYLNQWRFKDVAIHTRLLRHYPFGPAFTHVLGYMGRINQQELGELDAVNYSATNYIGKLGIEKYYEDTLHGTVGNEQVETDANGRIVRTLKRTPPIPGSTLYLTIDAPLQLAIETVMEDYRGAVVAIQPKTGEVIAFVSNPSYDANPFVTGISSAAYTRLQKDPDKPLYNRALRGLYAPGSTVKPYFALAALIYNAVTPQYTLTCPGWFSLPNSAHVYRDWRKHGHGRVNLQKAITESCDVYFFNLSVRLGIENIDKILTAFGFGKNTDIDMGEELPGIVPSPAWKLNSTGAHWYRGDTVITSIGQGFNLVTPLQAAAAVATLGLRGEHFQPHLLLKQQSSDSIITNTDPIILPKINASKADWDLVHKGMRDVVASPMGTAYPPTRFGHDTPYSVAGKTGTVQRIRIKDQVNRSDENLPEHLRENSWFIAFAPVENPAIALAVIVENSHDAPVIARKVLDFYFINQKHWKKDEKKDAIHH
ncbi:penicillin-binding protein 2 [soil metagenome]